MNLEVIVLIIVAGLLLLVLIAFGARRAPRRLNQQYFEGHWRELLSLVKTPHGLIVAVIDADKLLDEALKRRRFKGKTMGERLVAAQRHFSDNDGVWYAHKLRNRLVHEPGIRLKEPDAKRALAGVRQGLRDLGAL